MNNLKFHNFSKYLAAVVVVVFIILFPMFADVRWQHIFIMSAMWSIVSMGFLIIFRQGELSLGQVGFLCVGAYVSGVLTLKFNISFWIALIAAGLASMLISLLIGLIVLRLRGLYFAIITLCFAEVLVLTISQIGFLGGSEGIWPLPRPGDLGPVTFATKTGWLYLMFLLLTIVAIIYWRIGRSRIGRLYACIGVSPDLAESLGVHIMKSRLQAFVFAGLTTGLAGGVYAHYLTTIGPGAFSVTESLIAVLISFVGGISYLIAGPLAGAFLLITVDDYLGLLPGARFMLYGLLLLVIMFFLPGGLVSGFRKLWMKVRR